VFTPSPLSGSEAAIEGDDYHHLTRSLRLKLGEPLRLVDPAGRVWESEVTAIDRREARVRLRKDLGIAAALAPLELALCCPSGDALDAALEAATQLGVTRVLLLLSARSQRPDPAKMERWTRIVRESCCQSLRAFPPSLEGPLPLEAGLGAMSGRRFLAWQEGGAWDGPDAGSAETLGLLVGPEGGFEASEIAAARAAGFQAIKLAEPVLRSPVAVAAGLALLNHRRGHA
jgi:16S rRNA (uracil1498-N3)-methyltransferase